MTEEKKNKNPYFSFSWWLTTIAIVLAAWLIGYLTASTKAPSVQTSVVGELPRTVVTEPKKSEPRLTDPTVMGVSKSAFLTPQQLAQANGLLAAFEGKPLNELIQVYGAMQMAVVSVSPEDRPVFEFVLAKLGVYIAELER